MKPNEIVESSGGGGGVATEGARRDSVVPFDTLDAVLLDSQGPVALGSRAASVRSSISSAGTAPLPHTVISLDTAMAFRAGPGTGPQGEMGRAATEFYRVDDDSYRPFTIYGGVNVADRAWLRQLDTGATGIHPSAPANDMQICRLRRLPLTCIGLRGGGPTAHHLPIAANLAKLTSTSNS
ncbi:AGAP000663-PA-like protein [Anopheles sinensis]|uniref:AGAP000663-PA-like protein n=1 Tax=Anopheles sinensis TaxID=74873 RepID=A0A084VVN4_ANOSI|nr:AGAP000663-PA-like protein [Anopheles sinensis]